MGILFESVTYKRYERQGMQHCVKLLRCQTSVPDKETSDLSCRRLARVPEVFLACGGNFSVLAEGRHIFGHRPKPRAAGHYKDLTETGNRARKVSGTQGSREHKSRNTREHKGGGVLPYMAYTGKCRLTEYGFRPRCPKQRIQFRASLS